MKCKNCGSELPNYAMFCENCGCRVTNNADNTAYGAPQNGRICRSCGAPLEPDEEFCAECGARFAPNIGVQTSAPAPRSGGNSNTLKITAIILGAICLVLAAIIVGYFIYPSSTDNAAKAPASTAAPAVTETPAATEDPVPTPDNRSRAPEPEHRNGVARADLYSPGLTYKRMSEIHNTVPADDITFDEMKRIIEGFNRQCSDYMNDITSSPPSYLKYGSTAYRQQVEYKQNHPTQNQSYQRVDIINARVGGGCCYVWVTEVMDVSENGAHKTSTDHWVYKIEDGLISDYTADPAFN